MAVIRRDRAMTGPAATGQNPPVTGTYRTVGEQNIRAAGPSLAPMSRDSCSTCSASPTPSTRSSESQADQEVRRDDQGHCQAHYCRHHFGCHRAAIERSAFDVLDLRTGLSALPARIGSQGRDRSHAESGRSCMAL